MHLRLNHLLACFSTTLFLCGCSNCSDSQQKHLSSPDESHLTIATINDPLSLDPRQVRDLPTTTVMRMLFEGLMRTDGNGQLVPGSAERVEISDDQKTYTFTLRSCTWSDGTPLTAEDFEKTWKSSLSPDFPAPNAYQLYVIKGAKEAKERHLPLEQVGIKATSPLTLVVELEQPIPYFLEMTACHFYFPVHSQIRQSSSSPQPNQAQTLISNGPFKIDSWKARNEFSVIKNPLYWDSQLVKLDRVTLQVLDEHTALQLFKNGDLDWAGSPLSTLPQDAVAPLKLKGLLQVTAGAGTHWFRFNTEHYPFDNEKMRRAFSLALDRRVIVDHVTQGNQLPALGIIPPIFGLPLQYDYADHASSSAQNLFYDALNEMEIIKEKLPEITLSYAANDRNHKIAQAVQQQWNKTFGIHVALESIEGQVIFEKMRSGLYQISLGAWYADINDPINFLELFKSRSNPTNQTFWQNSAYAQLLEQSSQEKIPSRRFALLAQAEQILIEQMPVAPLFHSAFNYLKKPEVANVYFSPLGYLDFKEAYIQPKD